MKISNCIWMSVNGFQRNGPAEGDIVVCTAPIDGKVSTVTINAIVMADGDVMYIIVNGKRYKVISDGVYGVCGKIKLEEMTDGDD